METFEVGMMAKKQGKMSRSYTVTTLKTADSMIRFQVRKRPGFLTSQTGLSILLAVFLLKYSNGAKVFHKFETKFTHGEGHMGLVLYGVPDHYGGCLRGFGRARHLG